MKPLFAAQTNLHSYMALRAPDATARERELLDRIDREIAEAIKVEHDHQTAIETLNGQLQSALAVPMAKRKAAR